MECISFAVAIAKAGNIFVDLAYGLELVRKAKINGTGEYISSLADSLVIRSKTTIRCGENLCCVGHHTYRVRKCRLWVWKAKICQASQGLCWRRNKGEEGIVVSICLPMAAMEGFAEKLETC
ncbi:hypothetical protein Nepgr_012358 [Nepenthes gracilis]|uniref:Uncharacterized protein n=1 Tax=Nepenthes gracilis TaxID=150966 RepID=A0AAD3SH63_NEPGR|nr:hypothetical protein Nepgr_012358 [Nepenthes gracilis]